VQLASCKTTSAFFVSDNYRNPAYHLASCKRDTESNHGKSVKDYTLIYSSFYLILNWALSGEEDLFQPSEISGIAIVKPSSKGILQNLYDCSRVDSSQFYYRRKGVCKAYAARSLIIKWIIIFITSLVLKYNRNVIGCSNKDRIVRPHYENCCYRYY
jgi:hypothetical protein